VSQLKNCPFCGGKAILGTVGRDWYRIEIHHKTTDCIIFDTQLDYSQDDEGLAVLINDWNTRNSIPISQIEEALSLVEIEDVHIGERYYVLTKVLKKLIEEKNAKH